MLYDYLISVSLVPPAEGYRSIRDGPDRAPPRGRIIDSIVGTGTSENGMATRFGVTGRNTAKLEGGSQKSFPERLPPRVVVISATPGRLKINCLMEPGGTLVFSVKNPPILEKSLLPVIFLHHYLKAISRLWFGVEVDLPGKDLGKVED
jgi:hypothetical protein